MHDILDKLAWMPTVGVYADPVHESFRRLLDEARQEIVAERAILARLKAERDAAVAREPWQLIETAPEGVPVRIRSIKSNWYATAKLVRSSEDGEGGRFPATAWTILHYNGNALLQAFYGTGDMEWAPLAPPTPAAPDQGGTRDVAGGVDG